MTSVAAAVAAHPYELALVSGALIIVVFAYDRLNRPSYDAAVKQARLLKLLNPADLQRRSAFVKAYLVYTGLILAVYVLISLAGTWLLTIVTPEEAGLPAPPMGPEVGNGGIGPFDGDPRVPLYAALLLVGVFPAVPWLQSLETVFRRIAHTLAGIPHRVFAVAHAVDRTPLSLADLSTAELSTLKQRELKAFVGCAEGIFGVGAQSDLFARRLAKLYLLQRWLSDGRHWTRAVSSEALAQIESELMPAFFALEEDLRDLAERHQEPDMARGLAEQPMEWASPPVVAAEARWRKVLETLRSVHDEFCLLFALYLTRTGVSPGGGGTEALREFLGEVRANERRIYEGFDVLVAYLIMLAGGMFVAGYTLSMLGLYGWEGQSSVGVAAGFLLSTLLIYFPAAFVAIVLREGARTSGRWREWTAWDHPPASQFLVVFALGYAASAVTLVGFYFLLSTDGDVFVDWSEFAADGRLSEQLVFGLLGAIHAVFFVIELDGRGNAALAGRFRWLPLWHAATLAAVVFFILDARYPQMDVTELAVSAGLAALFGLVSGVFTLGWTNVARGAPADVSLAG